MHPIEILLIEDDASDARLLQRWLTQSQLVGQLYLARDGPEGLQVLRRQGPFRGCRRPDLIVLDVNLPGLDGFEVLSEIRSDAQLDELPVIILTGTVTRQEIERAETVGANRCLAKPSDADEFTGLVRAIEDFWRGWTAGQQGLEEGG